MKHGVHTGDVFMTREMRGVGEGRGLSAEIVQVRGEVGQGK